MKKTVAILVAAIMFISCMPFAYAAEIVDNGCFNENVTWTLDSEGTVVVSGEGYVGWDYDGDYSVLRKKAKAVVIEDGITEIGDHFFNGCNYLESVTMADSVRKIQFAFRRNPSLNNVVLSKGLEIMSDNVFSGCTGLKEILIPESVKTIEIQCFDSCTNLEKVVFSEGLENIVYSFECCPNLKSIELPKSLKNICGTAFMCSGIETLNIPENLEHSYWVVVSTETEDIEVLVPMMPFAGSWNLKEITVDKNNKNFVVGEDGVLYDKDMTKVCIYPTGSDNSEYVVPESIKEIYGTNFINAENLKAVYIHDKVEAVDCFGFGLNFNNVYKTWIEDDGEVIVQVDSENSIRELFPNFTLYGYSGTVTEASALENNIPFVALDAEYNPPADDNASSDEDVHSIFSVIFDFINLIIDFISKIFG